MTPTSSPASSTLPASAASRAPSVFSRRSILAATPLVLGTGALAACSNGGSSGSSDGGGESGGTLTIFTTGDELSFDPATSQNLAITTLGLVARRLTAWKTSADAPTELIPDLATDVGTVSDDGKTWTFTLQEGLLFEDGTPITAATVKYGLERSFAAELTGGLTYHKVLLEGGGDYSGPFSDEHLDSIETPDDLTLVFHLNRPYGDFGWIASTPAFAPVPEDSGEPETYATAPVASGPYRLESYSPGSRAVLVRNDNWEAGTDQARTGGPDSIEFSLSQDASVVAQSIIADRADSQDAFLASFVPTAQLVQAQNDPNVGDRLVTSGPGALEYLAMNTDSEGLKDVAVRQAIQYAVDKEAYRTAKGGEISGDYATTLITPGIAGREEYSLYADEPTGDADRASALLEEAGVSDLTLRLVITDDQTSAAEAIQQGLTRAGITVTIQPLDENAYSSEVTAGDGTGYDLVLSSWQPDVPSPNAILTPLFDSSQIGNGNYNLARYDNPDVDAAILEASSTVDADEAHAKWAAVDQQILKDAPVVPLIYSKNSFIHGSGVQDFVIGEFPAYPNYLTVTLG
ncbi:ABC transporter substrate-binding protein [Brachybacterium alimentarium]|uniref:ABC transporter substrate-binding protein n=1 Tax=Brachybacterium alimentarium TaxID=47845 RepID=UPI000DF353F2|nr:ABC transporter substrate-binding protein [Brachybacterium alimentarium]RCS81521.1 ABC transporter substrate-binding protein [Brachybacterium alimentarium]